MGGSAIIAAWDYWAIVWQFISDSMRQPELYCPQLKPMHVTRTMLPGVCSDMFAMQVGADVKKIRDYASRVLGWVSDFGTESDLPMVPAIDLARYLQETADDTDEFIQYMESDSHSCSSTADAGSVSVRSRSLFRNCIPIPGVEASTSPHQYFTSVKQ